MDQQANRITDLTAEVADLRKQLQAVERELEAAEVVVDHAKERAEDAERESSRACDDLTKLLAILDDHERGIRDFDEVKAVAHDLKWAIAWA